MAVTDAVRKLIAGTLGSVNLRNNLERILGLYVEEAPEDGTPYARQDAGWVAAGSGGGVTVRDAGVDVGTRPAINLIEGSNITLTITDDAGNGEVDVTIDAAGGGGGAIRPTAFFDGTPDAILVGTQARCTVTANCTITGWTILADQSGSCVIDIWKDTYANYPATVADSITGSAKPTLSASTKATSTTLTGWTTALTAGDTLVFNVDSASTVEQVYLVLEVS